MGMTRKCKARDLGKRVALSLPNFPTVLFLASELSHFR